MAETSEFRRAVFDSTASVMTSGQVFIPGVSQPQGSTKSFVIKGRAVTTTDNKSLYSWRSDVQSILRNEIGPEIAAPTGPVALGLVFVLPRRAAEPKRTTPAHTRKPDLDKLTRAANDAGTGLIYADDGQIDVLGAMKRTAEIGEQPGMWLTWSTGPVVPQVVAARQMVEVIVEGRHRNAVLVEVRANGHLVLELVT